MKVLPSKSEASKEPLPASGSGALIQMRGIIKRFGPVLANDHIDLDVRPGEIHAIVGQNGAGKTTLMRILFGLVRPDAGSITVNGTAVTLRSPRDALALSIGMVHQHFLLVPTFSVAENVVLGGVRHRGLRRDRVATDPAMLEALAEIGFEVKPEALVGGLPVDVQQRVEILKLLYRGATTLILDEPTASLGPKQIRDLFVTLKDLRAKGRSLVIITHKLPEVVELADRVTVIRQGRVVAGASRGSFDDHALAVAMLGSELPDVRRDNTRMGEVATRLRLRGVTVTGDRGENALDGLDLAGDSGEIVGVAGVEGNGQRELAELLAGLRVSKAGTIEVNGCVPRAWNPRVARQMGIGVCTEDRHNWDLFLDLTVADNLAAVEVAMGIRGGRWLRRSTAHGAVAKLMQEFGIEPADPRLMAAQLSGGNQQKLILARELGQKPLVMVAAQPTRGLDVGSALFVQRQLIRLREAGCCIVLISNDLDEVMKLADRVVVLYRGRVAYAEWAENVVLEELARAMAGLNPKAAKAAC